MKPVVVTLTGPSCAGKSTLEKLLEEKGFARLISTTTRAPRPGDKHGENYYFVSPGEFEQGIRDGDFVEHVQFDGNLYGGSVAEFKRHFASSKPVVVVCEPNGRDQIAAYCERNGWACVKVYVGNRAEVIAKRFLARFMLEYGIAKGSGHVSEVTKVGKMLESNARRMATMMTTEQAWQLEALARPVYDLTFNYFDESNDQDAADMVMWAVQKRSIVESRRSAIAA